MTVRLSTARAAVHAILAVYKPVHVHITPDYEQKLDVALGELEAAAVEAAQPPAVVTPPPVFDGERFHASAESEARPDNAPLSPPEAAPSSPPPTPEEAAEAPTPVEPPPASSGKRKPK